MKSIIVLGATGLLGQSIITRALHTGHQIYGVASKNSDFNLDVRDINALQTLIYEIKPDIVVNCIANVNLAECEQNPEDAYVVNARPAALLSRLANVMGFKSIFVSTDHYYCGDGRKLHVESEPVTLVNEYARTKYAGECFASLNTSSLILRTNIVGHRWRNGAPTFAEWAIGALENRQKLTLFDDVFSSPIHVDAFSKILFDLINLNVSGIINLASRDVSSKKEFIESLASQLDIELDWANTGSGKSLIPVRADSMGLSVEKIEKIVGYNMPSLLDTVNALAIEHKQGKRVGLYANH